MAEPELLTARHVLEYTYRRSVGPVLGCFFAALRARRILGIRAADGRVLVPPQEYDPETGAALSEWVPVGPGGVVQSWTFVARPRPVHPLERPFAFALIRLDGADTAMLHAVDVGDEAALRPGLRVRPRWRAETRGEIGDLACFEPEDA